MKWRFKRLYHIPGSASAAEFTYCRKVDAEVETKKMLLETGVQSQRSPRRVIANSEMLNVSE